MSSESATILDVIAERFKFFLKVINLMIQDCQYTQTEFSSTLLKFLEYAKENGLLDKDPKSFCEEICWWKDGLEGAGLKTDIWEGVQDFQPKAIVYLTKKEHGVSKKTERAYHKYNKGLERQYLQEMQTEKRIFNLYFTWRGRPLK